MERTRKPKTAPKLKQPYTNSHGVTVMLTDNQKKFVDSLLNAKSSKQLLNDTQSIYETNRTTASVIVNENLKKPNIIEYLGDRGYRALDVLDEAMNSKRASWSDRIRAADSIADRQFGKPVITSVNKNLNVNLEQALNDLL